MKLPFVSRETYEGDIHYARFERDTARASDEFTRRIFADLLDKFTKLKLAGAVLPEPVTPREAKEIDPLKQAVLNASIGKPPSVRAAMLKQLAEDMKAVEVGTMTAMDVQRRIETGFTNDDGVPE